LLYSSSIYLDYDIVQIANSLYYDFQAFFFARDYKNDKIYKTFGKQFGYLLRLNSMTEEISGLQLWQF